MRHSQPRQPPPPTKTLFTCPKCTRARSAKVSARARAPNMSARARCAPPWPKCAPAPRGAKSPLITLDTLGFGPRAFRMRSGCDATTPCAHT